MKGLNMTTKKTSKTQMAEKLEAAGVTSVAPESVVAEKAIALTYERLNSTLSGWSKTETSDAMDTVNFAITKMVEGAESKMSVGTRFNDFAKAHGADKARVLIQETAKLGISGLTESNIALWQKRSAMLLIEYPNPLIRRYVLALTGGEGIIIRDESFDAKDKDGNALPKPYILSPFYAQAAEKHADLVKTNAKTTSDEVAEKVARTLHSTASGLRTTARNKPEDARIRDAFKAFGKRTSGWIGKHESLVWDELYKLVKLSIQNTNDLGQFDAFSAKIDNAAGGAEVLNGGKSKGKAA
jgi:hypothetical protein